MARNLQQKGDVLTFVAGVGGVESGDFILIEGALVVALNGAAQGESFEGSVSGVYSGAPAVNNSAFNNFESLYWDAGNAQLTDDDNDGANVPVGRCVGGKAETATTCSILLDPSAK